MQVKTRADTWTFINDIVVPGLYDVSSSSDNNVETNKLISNGYSMRLGPPRLRQLRVTPGK